MPKATIEDIVDLGFQAAHFSSPEDWDIDEATGYLKKILIDVEVDVRNHVSNAVYDAASASGTDEEKQNFVTIRRAEVNLVAAELWSRRIIHLENSVGRSSDDVSAMLSEFRRNAQSREDKAWNGLAFLTGAKRSGSFSTGVVETGQYPETT